jgi:hypothetical protein
MRIVQVAVDYQHKRLQGTLRAVRYASVILGASIVVLSLELANVALPSWFTPTLIGVVAGALGALAGSSLSSIRTRAEERDLRKVEDQLEGYHDAEAER